MSDDDLNAIERFIKNNDDVSFSDEQQEANREAEQRSRDAGSSTGRGTTDSDTSDSTGVLGKVGDVASTVSENVIDVKSIRL